MKKYIGYIRVSTQRQGTHGVSLQEQKSSIEAYAKRNNLNIVQWVEERQTAAKRGRREFIRVLASLSKGGVDGVVIHKIDRGARNPHDWADLGELIDRGVDVHFAHDTLDLRSRGGRLAADIQAVVAADFVRNLKEETRKGMEGRLKQGFYPWRAPLGYLDMGGGRRKEIDPVAGILVREAFELYATGEWNFHTLPAEMYRRGLRGRVGAHLSKNALTIMLNNPFYMGIMHIRKTGQSFQGQHEPLISKRLYDQVQSVLRGRRDVAGSPKHDFLFRRMIRCTNCGLSLIGEKIKGRYIYYRCHTDGCQGTSLKDKQINGRFRDLFSKLALDADELRDLRDLVHALRRDDDKEREQRVRSVKLQLTKCDERLARLTDALIDLHIDKDSFNKRKDVALAEKRGLLDRLDAIATEPSLADTVNEYLELANTAQVIYETGIREEIRHLVSETTSNFSAHRNDPVITLKSPFQEMLNQRNLACCDQRRDNPRKRAEGTFNMLVAAAQTELLARASGQTQLGRGETPLPT